MEISIAERREHAIRFHIAASRGAQEVWVESSEKLSGCGGNAALAIALPAAIAAGEALKVAAPVSPRIAGRLGELAAIYAAWIPLWPPHRALGEVPVAVEEVGEGEAGGGGGPASMLFYSGGLDGTYSLGKHYHPITHLTAVHGFDIPLGSRFEAVAANLRRTSARSGKQAVVVKTNVREFSDRYAAWAMYHGAALAGVALLHEPGEAIIGSSYTYADLHPWGSHPLLDPLWSTAHTRIVHDGCEADRLQKIVFLKRTHPELLSHLRVCWQGGAETNCGHCEKCIRTALDLMLAGASEDCESLPRTVSPAQIRKLDLGAGYLFWRHFPESGLPRELRAAAASVVSNHEYGLPPFDGSLGSRLRRYRAAFRRSAGAVRALGK